MDEMYPGNRAELTGAVAEAVRFSHESRGIRFYIFPLETLRLSGTPDRLNVVLRENMLSCAELSPGSRVRVEGELRSYNNRSGTGSRLVLTVLARTLTPWEGVDDDRVALTGTICKKPCLRVTPMGREICDLILAVARRYRRSDYIPVILWGALARQMGRAQVGDRITVRGRLQSRIYTKVIDGESFRRTAFEVSAADAFFL